MTIEQFSRFDPKFRQVGSGADIVSIFTSADEQALIAATPLRRVALIGTFAPRQCGIATFTTDIFEKLAKWHPEVQLDVYALDNGGDAPLRYAPGVAVLRQDEREDYMLAARRINESGADAVWLQHEYGIFGGPDGDYAIELINRIAAPLILTLHTVLGEPSDHQREILDHLLTRASRVMVMSDHSRRLLEEVYHARSEIIEVIAHGAPDRPHGRGEAFKERFRVAGRNVLMTFGLIGPGKGLEMAIEALPAIVARHPDTVYRIVGATHPTLVARDGEAYRNALKEQAERLGVAGHIIWEDRFVETDELLDQLEACDIYLTPYHNLQQSTSGTLSYAVALGKAVVSTPYVHARELLADGVGALIEPKSSPAIAAAVNALLDDRAALAAMQRRAYAKGRTTIWPRFADATAQLIENAVAPQLKAPPLSAVPGLGALLAMTDGTGMLQHAIGIVPDRRHGYCLDDNVRALMLINVADGVPPAERARLQAAYAGFIQHAWNPDHGRFRNFMNFDRSWCEDVGSEDSNGRALWALGQTMERAADADLRRWARGWYDCSHGAADEFGSPRAIAFAMLGAAAVQRSGADHKGAAEILERGGELLSSLLSAARRPDWAWFEAVVGYDNPRLCQALIEAGQLCGRTDWLQDGLSTFEWIAARQLSATGQFRPIGSESFNRPYDSLPFDQQPLEAQAAIEAAASAHRAAPSERWRSHALAAFAWFFGANDRGAALADITTGRCRDGVTPRGVNENCGAESILAFQLAHYSLQPMLRQPTTTGAQFEPGQRNGGRTIANP